MADRIIFLQLGRYFWGGYIPKSGHKTPWIGNFWSGQAQQYKRGLEILGIGVVDADKKECMTLCSHQTPDTVILDNIVKESVDESAKTKKQKGSRKKSQKKKCKNENAEEREQGYTIVDWYAKIMIQNKERFQKITRNVVADAFFSKDNFITPLTNASYEVISRLRKDSALYYPTTKERTGLHGRPVEQDSEIDFKNLDTSRWFAVCLPFNMSLSSINVARAFARQNNYDISIGSVKTLLHNAAMMERFISTFGKRPNLNFNNTDFKELLFYGVRNAS